MATSNESTVAPARSPISDQRSTPRGVLPRQLQMWLMIGLAAVILTIIFFTGRAAPPARASSGTRPQEPASIAPDRIQTYQRQLAEDEARLRRELARNAEPAPGVRRTTNRGGEARPTDPMVEEQRRREYQSLFADNVALSRRPADASSYGERSTANRPFGAPGLSAGQVVRQEPSSPQVPPSQQMVIPPTASGAASRVDGPTPERQAPSSQGQTTPKETGPIRSSDARQRLSEGTIIETVLINRLNGSFAGPVDCLVTTPVYSHDRQRMVIPAGARVLGTAAPVQTWGDSRLAVSFHRLLMPDGSAYSLDQFKGLDQIGETGLKDEVNRHYLQVFGASVAIGALSGLAQYGTSAGFGPSSFGDQYRQAAGASLASSAGRVLDRYLNVLPTITIREGYRIKVYLTNDLDLPAFPGEGVRGVQ
jgi:type IV secretion system protein TrbI